MMRLLVTTVVSAASTTAPVPAIPDATDCAFVARNTDDVVGRSLGARRTSRRRPRPGLRTQSRRSSGARPAEASAEARISVRIGPR